MEIATNDGFPFSYNLACPMYDYFNQTTWHVFEKGSEKSSETERPLLSVHNIRLALCGMREHIWRTACDKLQIPLLKDRGFKIYLKEERYQFTETIKARGIVHTLLQLSDDQKRKGVIAISTGYFAQSLCYFGKKFGIPVTVVIPSSVDDEALEVYQNRANLQATVIVQGDDMIDAHNIALHIAQQKGLAYIDRNDHPNMIIGQATLGIEILESFKKIDAVILPTIFYGCGLTMGIAMAIKGWKPNVEVIEVRSISDRSVENIRRLTNSLEELEYTPTIYKWHEDVKGIPSCWIDRIITVNGVMITNASELLVTVDPIVDINTSIGLAAILSGQLDHLKKKRVILPVYGKMDSVYELLIDTSQLPVNPIENLE